MSKTYVLYRCGGEGNREPVACFSADSEVEAREAPTWLRRRHPENRLLRLGPGEFFEVVEKDFCSTQEWEQAVAQLEGGNVQGS